MIDYLKLDITYLGREHLENCGLTFAKPGMINQDTGEFLPDPTIKAEAIARYKNLLFEIFKSGKIQLSGSLHCYSNEGKHNYNNFSFNDLRNVIIGICKKFKIDPHRTTVHHLEFGINLYDLLFSATQIVQNLLIHSGLGNGPEIFAYEKHKTPSEFKRIQRDWYTLKIYDKGKHYQKSFEAFRIECKAIKMIKLIEMGICNESNQVTLDNLLDKSTMDKLGAKLQYLWNGVLLNDWTIRENELSPKYRSKLKDWRNPIYWTNLKAASKKRNRNQFNRELDKYKSIIRNHSENIHQVIMDSLIQNWCKNTTEKLNTVKTEMVQEHPFIIDDLAPIPKTCEVTGIDISIQKEGSRFLRESTLKKIYVENPELFEYLKKEFGPKKESTFKKLLNDICKNIRNRVSNRVKGIRVRDQKYAGSLFPFTDYLKESKSVTY